MGKHNENANVADDRPVGAGPSVTRATTIGQQLRLDIMSGRLTPGSKLHLEDLRAEMGVSLSPLREGLSRLVAEGFVTSQDQRGYSVAPVSKANLLEILELRTTLEVRALRVAIEQGDDAWETDILSAHHLLSKIGDQERWTERFYEEWEDRHRAFHSALIKGSNAPLLLHFCQMLWDMGHRYRRIFVRTDPPKRNIGREHKDLLEATLRRDADAACKILEDHIQRTGQNILRNMP
ncbi:GntR family transcriptional regulator [Paraburkholderia fungorum]|uniref:GntR family transcriptional regulator n=1 Tax=Paraburkholderia fungorum TaxID=134537 RepID=UPI0038BD09EA